MFPELLPVRIKRNVGSLDSLRDIGKVTLEIGNSTLIVEHIMDRGRSVIFIIHDCSVVTRYPMLRILYIKEVRYNKNKLKCKLNYSALLTRLLHLIEL